MSDPVAELGRRVGRNSLYTLSGEAATKLLAAVYHVLLARYLGTSLLGELSFALALTAILGVAADLGLATLTTRDTARRPEAARAIARRALGARLLLALAAGLAGVALALGTGRPRQVVELVAILALTQLVHGVAEISAAAHRGRQRMLLPSAAGLLARLGLVLSGLAAIALDSPIHVFAALTAIWAAPAAAVLYLTLPRTGGAAAEPSGRHILVRVLPIGLGAVFWTFYFRVDPVLIAYLRGDAEVGLYSAAFRLVEAVLLLQAPVLVAVFPILAGRDPSEEAHRAAFRQTVRLLALIGAPLCVLLAVEHQAVLALLYGPDFARSAPTLLVLSFAIPASFAAAPFLHLLVSRDRERSYAKIMACGAVVDPVLTLLLVAGLGLGFVGAAWATLATEWMILVLAVRVATRLETPPRCAAIILRTYAAALLLAAALLGGAWCGLSFPVRITLGIVVLYPILALATGALRRIDVRLLLSTLDPKARG